MIRRGCCGFRKWWGRSMGWTEECSEGGISTVRKVPCGHGTSFMAAVAQKCLSARSFYGENGKHWRVRNALRLRVRFKGPRMDKRLHPTMSTRQEPSYVLGHRGPAHPDPLARLYGRGLKPVQDVLLVLLEPERSLPPEAPSAASAYLRSRQTEGGIDG